jgi:hypothetical protein
MGASKEKETTLALTIEAEKGAKPPKEATRVPAMEAINEGDATHVPMTKAKGKGKEKLPSLCQANPKV